MPPVLPSTRSSFIRFSILIIPIPFFFSFPQTPFEKTKNLLLLHHRNVSFALLLIGVISPTRFVLYMMSQFLGSIGTSKLQSKPPFVFQRNKTIHHLLSTFKTLISWWSWSSSSSIYVYISLSLVASAVLQALLPGPLAVTPALGAGTNLGQGLFIECFTTCALILSVLFLAVEKHRATFLAPVGIGITLFAGHMFVKSNPLLSFSFFHLLTTLD